MQEYITIRGARENNLKDVSLRIPKRKITIFTGVSGSGKSSIVFAIMDRLVDEGNTVVVTEHNTDVMRNADWIIDLGPEGGNRGGRVMFEGTPRELQEAAQSLTSRYMRD